MPGFSLLAWTLLKGSGHPEPLPWCVNVMGVAEAEPDGAKATSTSAARRIMVPVMSEPPEMGDERTYR
jgi:hypothetical protein